MCGSFENSFRCALIACIHSDLKAVLIAMPE